MENENEAKRQELIKFSKTLIRIPYKRGAKPRTPAEFESLNGEEIREADCSSFTAYIYWKALKIILPPSTILQATSGQGRIVSLREAEPGDLVFFHGEKGYYDFTKLPGKYIGHVAILDYNGKIIHSVNSGGKSGVVEHPFIAEEHPMYCPKNIVLIKQLI